MDVGVWLTNIGLGSYAPLFEEHRIGSDVLPELSGEDMKDLGIPLGDRKRLLKAIETLRSAHIDSVNTNKMPSTQSAERRQLTVVFCDLVGSTQLSERLDPEEMREILQHYQLVCSEIVGRFGGHVAKLIGDGILIYFGYPNAQEDDPRRAVQACVELVQAVKMLGLESQEGFSIDLDVRVGIHTGLVVIGEMIGGDTTESAAIVGETPNVASRLQTEARPGTVVISQSTFRLVEGLFTTKLLGELELKGISNPVTAYEVSGASDIYTRFEAGAQRGFAPIVGREEEARLLMKRWERAIEGERQLVLLSGEAGVGKSRLIRCLRDQLSGQDYNRILYYGSPYHRQTAYFPIIDQMQRALRFEPADQVQEKLLKLQTVLRQLGLSPDKYNKSLSSLLSILPDKIETDEQIAEDARTEILQSLIDVTEAMSAQMPVLIVVEDAHFLDPSSLEFLDLLLRRSNPAQLLAIAAFRPEMEQMWSNFPHATLLKLNRLSRRDTIELLRGILKDHRVSSEIIAVISDRTDGVPLFVEELARFMLDAGIIAEKAGCYELTNGDIEAVIPASLQDSLAARLDRLGSARATAQLASNLGRSFQKNILAAVSTLPPDQLDIDLRKLVDSGLIFPVSTGTNLKFEFKHALVCDAAYQSQLRSERRKTHKTIAREIERNFSDIAESQPEMLARHYTEAGMSQEAANYWQQAGDIAVHRSANIEAISHFTNGIEQLLSLPDTPDRARQEFSMQLAIGSAYVMTRGVVAPEVEKAFQRACELAPHVQNGKERFNALWGYYYVFEIRANWTNALKNISELMSLAEREADPGLILQAHHAAWTSNAMSGNLLSARDHIDQGHPLYDASSHSHHKFLYGGHDPHVCCHSVGGLVRLLIGDVYAGRTNLRKAVLLAQERDHPTTKMVATFFHSVGDMLLLDFTSAADSAQKTIAEALEHGNTAFIKMGTIMAGAANAALDQHSNGIEQMTEVLASARKHKRTTFLQSFYLGLLAEACIRAGRLIEGRDALRDAFQMMEVQNEHICEAELHRIRAELLLAESAVNREEAKASFEKAVEISRAQHAKSLELRATISLARYLGENGQSSEGFSLLSPITASFVDGELTEDIRIARLLCNELGK